MSEQTVSKSVHKIPDTLVEFFKEIYKQEISEVEFLRRYKDFEGTWEVIKVNKQFTAYMVNGRIWDITTAEKEREIKKAFGKRAKYVMEKANVSWELAKMAVKMNPVNSYNPESIANADALNFIEDVKEALENYRIFNGGRMSIEQHLRRSRYSVGYLSNKQIHIIKEYWLAQQNA